MGFIQVKIILLVFFFKCLCCNKIGFFIRLIKGTNSSTLYIFAVVLLFYPQPLIVSEEVVYDDFALKSI